MRKNRTFSYVLTMTAVLLSLILAVSSPASAACTSWVLSSDYMTVTGEGTISNPNPDACDDNTWSLLGSAGRNPLERTPKHYKKLFSYHTKMFVPYSTNDSGMEGWVRMDSYDAPINLYGPFIAKNATGNDQYVAWSSFLWPSNAILLHPTMTSLTTVAWQAPLSGTYSVAADLKKEDPCGDGIDYYIDKGNKKMIIANLATGSLWAGQAASYSGVVSLEAREYLYFTIHPRDNQACDATILEVIINQ